MILYVKKELSAKLIHIRCVKITNVGVLTQINPKLMEYKTKES
jgi:hypothetical protein